ncbi:MAG: DNA mismatch repair protein MutS [Chitinophagales bacterium]|nr:DNA mismatch repair protein MutS [Chitinophagales bacterium]
MAQYRAVKNKSVTTETPLMQQYKTIKAKYPDAILLFRVGDFYETFDTDAVLTSKVLGMVLTKRANGAAAYQDLAGFPYHALDTYLPKLVRAGYRVAICDQLEDAKLTKEIVKRGVTELVTPGITDNEKILDNKSNNFLCALHFENNIAGNQSEIIGAAFLDISTGEFYCAQGSSDYIDKLLQSLKPSEVIFSKQYQKQFLKIFGSKFYTFAIDDWVFQYDYCFESLTKHFETQSLKGFGISEMPQSIIACGAAMHYLQVSEHPNLGHIISISRIDEGKYVWLDRFTIRNLEMLHSNFDGGKSLLQILDHTLSPMGARTLRRWMVLPLKDIYPIEERLEMVELLIKDPELNQKLSALVRQIGDLERLIAKVALGKISPREIVYIRRALNAIAEIKELLSVQEKIQFKNFAEQLHACLLMRERIEKEIRDDAPPVTAKGNFIHNNVSVELDELREISHSGKDYLLKIQKTEQERTGITSLKISFNNVFGYYLEVTNTHKSKVPPEWIRKQTLSNAERYITPELKEYEEKILGAEEKILALEIKLFEALVEALKEFVPQIQINAQVIGRLDCLLSFAHLAVKQHYCRPQLNDGFALEIKDGRHPVIEQQLQHDEQYVPNDCTLDETSQQIQIITGPNMAGKSAYIRQNALIVLMAQMGSFVPAASAKIGLVDKIFTRVGASDNIAAGESTFMVEMTETASILNNISERSLVILDEIGRGTSTYDGISIAWAIAEFLHDHLKGKAKTLFATHYHELNELENKFERIKNFNVSVKETGNKVIFLRKLQAGGAEHSFGIHVAKMAGIPNSVVNRANEIMGELEQKTIAKDLQNKIRNLPTREMQLSIFSAEDPELKKIKEWLAQIDTNALTPIEALMKIAEMKGKMKGD